MMAKYEYRIEDVFDNGEFLTSATLVLLEDGAEVGREEHRASSEFPNDGPAWVLAASSGNAWVESMTYSIEERLGPYGIEWSREQEERRGLA